jgi:uncharacterized phage protein (TIGR01671 family)
MREIKFRGKAKMSIEELDDLYLEHENGWVYGHLVMYGKTPYIVGDFIEVDSEYTVNEFWVPVYPESVGQFTGLPDKNGKGVYEGDIVRVDYESNRLYLEGFEITGEVIWFPEHAQFLVKTNVKHLKDGSTEYDLYEIADNEYYEVLEIEVIGNVFEDSHLLEEQHG